MKARHLRSLLVGLSLSGLVAGADPGLAKGEQLGTIHFETRGDAVTQEHVVRGVKLLHHMMYVEADREFATATAHDPGCAFAYWGRAMAIVHPLWTDVPNADDLKRGLDFVNAGLACPRLTAREKAYLGTTEAFFRAAPARSLPDRLKATDDAWAAAATAFPDDLDAAAFGALYHLAPARFLPKDKSHRLQFEAAAALDKIRAQIPDHPGALHYKIHAFDFPTLAGRALEVCDTYGTMAPEVPHALHMPSHIFTRQGEWTKSIEFNERSAAAARALIKASGATNSHLPHASDYLAYAYLQRGQDDKVEAIEHELFAITGPYQTTNRAAMAFAFAAIPARLALERQDWAAAATLPLHQPASFQWNESYLYCDSIVQFARALGAVRNGNQDAARREIAALEELKGRVTAVIPGSYWAAQSEVQLLTSRAWLALAQGKSDEAVAGMRRAAELEASTDKDAVTPGEVLPAGELLGDMLSELGRYREALAAFEAQLATSPNRLNGLAGAARAAEKAGDIAAAGRYWRQLLATVDPNSANPRLQQARTFLAAHPDGHVRAEAGGGGGTQSAH